MIIIDGSEGEGGGQVLRNACALSLITGQTFRITNIRGGRGKPGLMRQHVTAIEAVCAIGNAECSGIAVGSLDITFQPGRIQPGEYRFSVGTAGSTGLVLQTLLPPLMVANAPSRLVLEGGTHNMLAPPFEFIAKTFLPLVNRMGPHVDAKLVRHGFYPRGGGRIDIDINPAPLSGLSLKERGAILDCSVKAILSGLPSNIARREIDVVRDLIDWPQDAFSIEELSPDIGPGNILLIEAAFEQVTEIVSGFGKQGVSAEIVAKKAAARMNGYLKSDAFAGAFLADQLLLPLALAGDSEFTTVKPTPHALTAAALIERFTGRRISFEIIASGAHLVTIQ